MKIIKFLVIITTFIFAFNNNLALGQTNNSEDVVSAELITSVKTNKIICTLVNKNYLFYNNLGTFATIMRIDNEIYLVKGRNLEYNSKKDTLEGLITNRRKIKIVKNKVLFSSDLEFFVQQHTFDILSNQKYSLLRYNNSLILKYDFFKILQKNGLKNAKSLNLRSLKDFDLKNRI
jgi:hypothetical protein